MNNLPGWNHLNEKQRSRWKTYYCSGTWTLTGTNFSAVILSFVTPNNGAPVTQSMSGTYLDNGTITNGVWADTNNPNGTALAGKFSTMQKVN